mgnify:CR=1 FL=1
MVKIIGNNSLLEGNDPVRHVVRICFDMAKASAKIEETLETIGICLNFENALFDKACNYTSIMAAFLPVDVFNSDEWFDDILEIDDFEVYWNKYFGEEK